MHILVIDGGHVEEEFRAKFGAGHEYIFFSTGYHWNSDAEEEGFSREALPVADVAFLFGDAGFRLDAHQLLGLFPFPVFHDIGNVALTEFNNLIAELSGRFRFLGFCGLPTLLNRSLLEVSLYHEADRQKLAETCAALGTDFRVVEDRVGLVTPRVICMIINEACYTLQEGTASIQDIDLAMKLGTGYPRGPFEWANAIGINRVLAVLEALWDDTHDERYKICPLLKRQALRGEPFQIAD